MPISARGLTFNDFESCILWAEDQDGIDDARAFCGQLEAETKTTEVAQQVQTSGVVRQPNIGSGAVNGSTEGLPMSQQAAQQETTQEAAKAEQADGGKAAQEPAKQADQAPNGQARQMGEEEHEEMYSEMMRRLEALETTVGEIVSRVGGNDAEEAEDDEKDEKAEEKEEEADDNGEEDEDDEKNREAKRAGISESKATKLIESKINEALSGDNLKQALKGAIGELNQANPNTETSQSRAQQAEPTGNGETRQAETPDPSDSPSNQSSQKKLREAAKHFDDGSPTAFIDLLQAGQE